MTEGKSGISVQKQTLPGVLPAINFKDLVFYHKCVGGETFIDLTNLTMPGDSEYATLSNPTATELANAKLLLYPTKILFSRSGGGYLQNGEYQIVTSTKINLTSPALVNEIFQGTILSIPQTGIIGVDARKVYGEDTLLAGQTDINVGVEFKVNATPKEYSLVVDGFSMPLFRNAGNSPTGEGNYYEIPVSGGYGTVLRLNSSDTVDRAWQVIPTSAIIQRPDGSRDSVIESLSGAVDSIKAVLVNDFDYDAATFAANPSTVQLRQFGDAVIALQAAVTALQPNTGENLSALRQYTLTVTGPSSWTTIRAVGVPYQTLDGAWRLRFNIVGSSASTGTMTTTVAGIIFKNVAGYQQAITGYQNATTTNAVAGCYTNPNTGDITLQYRDAATTNHVFSGDVELESKPSFVP
jgi:hypothetical protein